MYKGTKAESSYYLSETTSPLVAVTVEKKAISGTAAEGDKVTEERQVPESLLPMDVDSIIEFLF